MHPNLSSLYIIASCENTSAPSFDESGWPARLTRVVLILVAVMLTACASTTGIAPQSTMQDARAVASSETLRHMTGASVTWPSDDWWVRYRDPQLTELIEEALNGGPTIRAVQARVRQAEAAAGLSEAATAVQANATAKTIRQQFSANSTVPKPLAGSWAWINDTSLNVTYELDFWGKNRAAIEAAIGRVKATEADASASRLLLAVAIAQTYIKLEQLYAQLELAQAALKQRQQIFTLTTQRVSAEIDSLVDLRQAEIGIPVAKERIAVLNESIALTKGQLASLAGQGPDRGLKISRPRMQVPAAFTIPQELPSALLARRPEIVAMRLRVDALSQDIAVAKAQFYPSINLTTLIGLQSLGFNKLLTAGSQSIGLGPALSLPILDGGRLRSNLQSRSAEYDIAVEQFNQSLLDAVRDVVSQLTSLQWLTERIQQEDLALQAAEEAYRLATKRYKSGLGNFLQVLTADSQVITLRQARTELAARALDLDVALTRALGGGYHDVTFSH